MSGGELLSRVVLGSRLEGHWAGDLRLLVRAACEARGIRISRVCSRERSAEVVTTRRLVILVAVEHLGRSVGEAAAAVGLSASGATRLLSRRPEACERLTPLAHSIADSLRRIAPSPMRWQFGNHVPVDLAALGLVACGPPPTAQTVTHSETATLNADGVRTNTDVRQTDTRRQDATETVQRTVVTNTTTPAPSGRTVVAGQPAQPAASR